MSFPFADYLRVGVAAGLSPADVWATSLRDLRALAGDAKTLDRNSLDALCQLFPDGDTDG